MEKQIPTAYGGKKVKAIYFILVIFILIFPSPSLALTLEETLENPALEQQAQAVFKDIRCVVCSGQSIADSRAGLANDLRKIVRDKIKEGSSKQQILEYISSRYGEEIMMQPPFKPATYLLWFTPALILIIACIVIFYNRRKLFK